MIVRHQRRSTPFTSYILAVFKERLLMTSDVVRLQVSQGPKTLRFVSIEDGYTPFLSKTFCPTSADPSDIDEKLRYPPIRDAQGPQRGAFTRSESNQLQLRPMSEECSSSGVHDPRSREATSSCCAMLVLFIRQSFTQEIRSFKSFARCRVIYCSRTSHSRNRL